MTLLLLLLACSDYKLQPEVGVDTALSAPTRPDGTDETDETDDTDVTDPPDCDDFTPPAPAGFPIDEGCLADFSDVGLFDPVIEWTSASAVAFADTPDSTSPYTMPAVANIDDDNGDGVVDALDTPDIVYTTFDAWKIQPGHLRVIDGAGRGEVWSVHAFEYGGATWYPSCLGGSAIGDLQGDGSPEVVTVTSAGELVAFDNSGAPLWVTSGLGVSLYAQPALADMDGDGLVEVIAGNIQLNHDGSVRGVGADGMGVPDEHAGSWGAIAVPVDLDGDGIMEVVAGNTIYADGGATLSRSGLGDGYTAVGDMDLDGSPEIVTSVHATGEVYLWETDGELVWSVDTGSGGGGAPTIADFDGDGAPEVGVAGETRYVVLDGDGTVLWDAAITDASSAATGSAVFDFDGNGAAEVVFADEVAFYVFDGATGAVLYQDSGHNHGTAWEYPVIADVDNDGNSEIIVGSAGVTSGDWDGITVLGSASESWAPSRPIWNQHAYHITNVTNDGQIPTAEVPNWETWNNFRAAGTELGPLHWRPDIEPGPPEICTQTCALDEITLYLPVGNGGLLATGEVAGVALVRDDGGVAWEGAVAPLPSGDGAVLGPITLDRLAWGDAGLTAVVDYPGALDECDEDNNTLPLGGWPCG